MGGVQHRMIQRDGEYLVGTARRVVAVFAVDDVVQVAAVRIPEARVERGAGPGRMTGQGEAAAATPGQSEPVAAAMLARPALEQTERVVPQRVDLDRLAAPRRDDPV